jgi:hypothetical protein
MEALGNCHAIYFHPSTALRGSGVYIAGELKVETVKTWFM